MMDENRQLESPYRERWDIELGRIERSLRSPGVHFIDTTILSSAAKHGIGNVRSVTQVVVYDDLIGLFSRALGDHLQVGFTEEVVEELEVHKRKLEWKLERTEPEQYEGRRLRVEQARELLAIARCLPAERFIPEGVNANPYIHYALEIGTRPGVTNDYGHLYGEKAGRLRHAEHDALIFGKGLAAASNGQIVKIPTRDSDLKNFRNRVKTDKKAGVNLELIGQDTLRIDYFPPNREAIEEYREHHEKLRSGNNE